MMTKKEMVKLDERQQHFLLRSYQIGFWTVIGLLWVQHVFGHLWTDYIAQETLYFAFLCLGVGVQTVYAVLKDAHPFLNQKNDVVTLRILLVIFVFAITMLGVTILNIFGGDGELALLDKGGVASFLLLYATLLSMVGSLIYKLLKNRREAEK